jgi:hypothetical protein
LSGHINAAEEKHRDYAGSEGNMALVTQQPVQAQKVVAKREEGGVTLGVLEDGTAFVNARGLADLCGIAASGLITWAQGWRDGRRETPLARFLMSKGVSIQQTQLHIPTTDGQHAYADWLVLLFLEYYSHDNDTAKGYLNKLAGHALRQFIYEQTNYGKPTAIPAGDQWKHFHDRLLLVDVPAKHFCVFKEMAGVVVMSINGGLRVTEHTVPDASVGISWGNFWEENNLDAQWGNRIKFKHNYPDYYPQAASNPQEVWAYPICALGVFRQWLEDEYLPNKFPAYLGRKVKQGVLAEGTARNVLEAVNVSPALLPTPKKKALSATPAVKALPAPKKPRVAK